jgi:hypothetical protein
LWKDEEYVAKRTNKNGVPYTIAVKAGPQGTFWHELIHVKSNIDMMVELNKMYKKYFEWSDDSLWYDIQQEWKGTSEYGRNMIEYIEKDGKTEIVDNACEKASEDMTALILGVREKSVYEEGKYHLIDWFTKTCGISKDAFHTFALKNKYKRGNI